MNGLPGFRSRAGIRCSRDSRAVRVGILAACASGLLLAACVSGERGAEGLACFTGSDPCGEGLVCVQEVCVAGGAQGQPCLTGQVCNTDLVCRNSQCVSGGGEGQPCLAGKTCADAKSVCINDACVPAGAEGEPCLPNDTCDSPLRCWSDGTCIRETTWVDTDTGLEWQGRGTGGFPADCDSLTWAGKTDWRAPTIEELRALVVDCATTVAGGGCVTCSSKESCSAAGFPGPDAWDRNMCHGCNPGAGPASGCYWKAGMGTDCSLALISISMARWDDGAHMDWWCFNFRQAMPWLRQETSTYLLRCVREP